MRALRCYLECRIWLNWLFFPPSKTAQMHALILLWKNWSFTVRYMFMRYFRCCYWQFLSSRINHRVYQMLIAPLMGSFVTSTKSTTPIDGCIGCPANILPGRTERPRLRPPSRTSSHPLICATHFCEALLPRTRPYRYGGLRWFYECATNKY